MIVKLVTMFMMMINSPSRKGSPKAGLTIEKRISEEISYQDMVRVLFLARASACQLQVTQTSFLWP